MLKLTECFTKFQSDYVETDWMLYKVLIWLCWNQTPFWANQLKVLDAFSVNIFQVSQFHSSKAIGSQQCGNTVILALFWSGGTNHIGQVWSDKSYWSIQVSYGSKLWFVFAHQAGHLSVCRVLCCKDFNIGHYTQTVQQIFFTPAMLIGTMDFCHFIPLSLTLTLPGGHKVSTKQNLLASFSWPLFIWSGWRWWSHWSWTSCFWVRFFETRGITAVLLASLLMFRNQFDSNLVWWKILLYSTYWY